MMVTSFPTKITKDEPGGLKYFLCPLNKSEVLFYIFSTIYTLSDGCKILIILGKLNKKFISIY